MLRAGSRRLVSAIHGYKSDADRIRGSPLYAVRWVFHRVSSLGTPRSCRFRLNGQACPFLSDAPVPALCLAQRSRWGDLLPSQSGSSVGLRKGTLRARRPATAASHPS
jgi:hypothetical protein